MEKIDIKPMGKMQMMGIRPKVAIIDTNMLSVLGLKAILKNVMPIIEIETFTSFDDFFATEPDSFFHYFVAQTVLLENIRYFNERSSKAIVLTSSKDPDAQLTGFHSFCVNVSEEELLKEILKVVQIGHAGGKHLPVMPQVLKKKILSNREIEVLALVVKGHINKEIAEILNIGLTTVITHRKNIVEKLGVRSVSALTIYAVMHGYVDINEI
ncbi:MAG: LuxR C-terminal-related transcriptional regulator [Prevotella sp.]|nr:LuxR C-terminal-related transcriptional regulator [Prevotella sp.]MDD7273242.1 LuxR C-terminal-related transcriptional regulator [Prevotellaceae bacterium]MDY3936621.1 LuxR C-terminal-related transcriptional regulator [Prevotella sp.]MDY4217945.1 LuxR C-terminal-related transcriptional regulator [Prevotella sp.]